MFRLVSCIKPAALRPSSSVAPYPVFLAPLLPLPCETCGASSWSEGWCHWSTDHVACDSLPLVLQSLLYTYRTLTVHLSVPPNNISIRTCNRIKHLPTSAFDRCRRIEAHSCLARRNSRYRGKQARASPRTVHKEEEEEEGCPGGGGEVQWSVADHCT
ncbi:uncharacterized protein LY79DRAFT_124450 [Colletotrichum navitas]|uniref:Uncharacterized protein n=1 Tax=Colletotrichum navitas TaxID=681940 RepID=A0AAD8Q3C4_9PEZI|nr:uncharacterized protein LY79DRAFT_124450 [Colletotrichum navitas]KAK1594759.1 hypothetical protein LY79DRAFT_124450 [Colletotrichum navitas]